jgi:uncharacterized membrane protein
MKALISKPFWLVRRQLRKIWVRVVGFAVFALATVLISQGVGRLLPSGWSDQLGADAVDQVLTILASSMLAVTTFSLSISVSAFSFSASSATPRATELLQQDKTTQNVLATFLGAFLFSLVGIVALKAGYYTDSGRLVLFTATVLVVALVVVALIRWISHLTDFGRMKDTLNRVENAATEAIKGRMKAPWLGGTPQRSPPPAHAHKVCSSSIGYVQHIDMEALSETAEKAGVKIWLAALPGSVVHPAAPILYVDGPTPDEDCTEKLQSAFSCDQSRDFTQDPVFGLIVMSEIASRALSPGVNDPGTAIDVLWRFLRILSTWRSDIEADLDFPNIIVPSLMADELLEAAFRPIARDGVSNFEVQMRLQKALRGLSDIHPATFEETARYWSRDAMDRLDPADFSDRELASLKQVAL